MRIGSLYEGSASSKIALDIYGQTRDDLMRVGDFGWARGDVALGLLKSAPVGGYVPPAVWSNTYPPLPWQFEYTYPDDCLKVRAIRATDIFIPNFDPQPVVFDTPNDNSYTPARKVIVCNVPNAILVYTRQVTNPTLWEASFTEQLVDALSTRLAPAVNPQAIQADAAEEQVATGQAAVTQG